MKKLFEYLKTLKLISKILIGVWAFFIIMVTLVCFSSLTGAFDIILLLSCYSVFSLFFLVPAIAINQAKRNVVNNDIEDLSDKSWMITLLLTLFLGYFGAHRFYVGKKKSGILYLFTAGIFGVGHVVDLILIILDKFKDSNGKSIKNKSSNQSIVSTEKVQTTTNEHERCTAKSISEKVRKADSPSNSAAAYSDIFVSGETEKRQAIPQRKQETEERKVSISSGLTLTIKPVISDDGKIIDFDFDDDYKYSSTRFSDEMIKFANKTGKEAPFVPFMQYWPS